MSDEALVPLGVFERHKAEAVRKADRSISKDGSAPKLEDLRGMSRDEYELRRKDLAETMGVRVSYLDEQFRSQAKATSDGIVGAPHWTAEPWHEPVGTKEVLSAIGNRLRLHVVMSAEARLSVSLWIGFAWVHDAAVHSPILIVTSPEPDCGKSTLLGLVNLLVPRGLAVVEISPAVLYRMIERWHPTLIVDEADDKFRNNPELRGVINAGWTRGTGVPRCNPETHEPELFETFGPKAIGLKGLRIPDTTLSRGIVIEMERKLAGDQAKGFKHVDDDELSTLRRKLARWSADNVEMIREAHPEVPEGFVNRLADNWRVMLAIADAAELGEKARAAAVSLSKRDDEASLGVELLADGLKIMESVGVDRMKSVDLVSALTALEERPWSEMPRTGKWITQPQISRILKQYKIKPVPMKIAGDKMGRGYMAADLKKVLDRYAPGSTPENRRNPVTFAENSQNCRNQVTPKMAENSQSYGVTPDSHPQAGEHCPKANPDEFEERAAILEYDGGLTRKDAEAAASDEECKT